MLKNPILIELTEEGRSFLPDSMKELHVFWMFEDPQKHNSVFISEKPDLIGAMCTSVPSVAVKPLAYVDTRTMFAAIDTILRQKGLLLKSDDMVRYVRVDPETVEEITEYLYNEFFGLNDEEV